MEDDRFVTRDRGLAQFLIHRRAARCSVTFDSLDKPVFSFVRSAADLDALAETYALGASVTAVDYARSGTILHQLIRAARFWEAARAEKVRAAGRE